MGPSSILLLILYLRLNWNWDISLGTRRGVLHRNQLGVDIAIQLIVYVEVALVLQGRATSCAPETFHMQVLVLDADEDAPVQSKTGGLDGGHQGTVFFSGQANDGEI